MEANEEYARLLFDDKIDENNPHSHFGLPLIKVNLWDNKILLSDCIKKQGTAKEFKDYLKEQNVDIKDFNEKDIGVILDAWPDFFDGEDLSEIKEGDEETRVPYTSKISTEFPMGEVSDSIYYIKPFFNNVKGEVTMEMSDNDAVNRLQRLLDPVEEEPKPVKTKMSYKQQQRMRKNNPMWKPNC